MFSGTISVDLCKHDIITSDRDAIYIKCLRTARSFKIAALSVDFQSCYLALTHTVKRFETAQFNMKTDFNIFRFKIATRA